MTKSLNSEGDRLRPQSFDRDTTVATKHIGTRLNDKMETFPALIVDASLITVARDNTLD